MPPFTQSSHHSRQLAVNWPVLLGVVVLLACAGFQLYVAQLPVPNLLEHAVNDDTFYYLEIAYRSAQGQGSTFDGIHLTSGFQPAWKAVLTAIAVMVRDKEHLLRASLIACTALNLMAGLFFFGAARLTMPGGIALAPLFLWAAVQLEPHLALSGMETSLNWLFFNMLLFFLLRMAVLSDQLRDGPRSRSILKAGMIGLLCGLLFYSRVDNALFIVGAALVVGFLPGLLHINHGAAKPNGLLSIAVLAIVAVVILPYLISNSLTFGTMLPISGLAKQRLNYDLVTAAMGGYLSLETAVHSAGRAVETVTWTQAQLLRVFGGGEPLWLAAPTLFLAITTAVLMATGLGVFVQRRRTPGPRRTLVLATLIKVTYEAAVVLVLFWVLYSIAGHFIAAANLQAGAKGLLVAVALPIAFVRGARSAKRGDSSLCAGDQIMTILLVLVWLHAYLLAYTLDHFLTYTSWYFANWFVVLALWVGIAGREFVHPGVHYQVRRALGLCVLTGLGVGLLVTGIRAFHTVHASPRTPPYGINGQYEMSQWLRANTPASSILAAFNAGTIGYFSERTTVNLDGLVNDRTLLEYNYQRRDLTAYLDRLCPDFIVDYFDEASLAEGQIPTGATIWGIDRSRLKPVKWLWGQGWGGQPQTHVVLSYDQRSCQR